MAEETDYYTVLGIERGCKETVVRRAYRNLLTKEHPDKGGSAEKFALIQRAYEVLSSDSKRKQYDTTGKVEKTADEELLDSFGGGECRFNGMSCTLGSCTCVACKSCLVMSCQVKSCHVMSCTSWHEFRSETQWMPKAPTTRACPMMLRVRLSRRSWQSSALVTVTRAWTAVNIVQRFSPVIEPLRIGPNSLAITVLGRQAHFGTTCGRRRAARSPWLSRLRSGIRQRSRVTLPASMLGCAHEAEERHVHTPRRGPGGVRRGSREGRERVQGGSGEGQSRT
eukprot:2200417-Pyramimonas_sp.AAC.1